MASPKKGVPDLSVGSTFLLGVGDHYPSQIKVISRDGEKVEVRISVPARPETCDQCGHDRNLSMNAVTGVVVCMTTGCGHDFGYDSVKKVVVNASAFATK